MVDYRDVWRESFRRLTTAQASSINGQTFTPPVHSGGQKFELERVAPYEPTVEELQAFTGKYFSKELETFYTVELHDTTLTLLIRNTEEIELSALKEDNYKGDIYFIGELVFQRDNTGQVNGFTAANGRTRGIVFEKQ